MSSCFFILRTTAHNCRLQCDLSVVQAADITTSHDYQELKALKICLWGCVDHLLRFLFFLSSILSLFSSLASVLWTEIVHLPCCCFLFLLLAIFAVVWEQICMNSHSLDKSLSSVSISAQLSLLSIFLWTITCYVVYTEDFWKLSWRSEKQVTMKPSTLEQTTQFTEVYSFWNSTG